VRPESDRHFDWIVFTRRDGVRAFAARRAGCAKVAGRDLRYWPGHAQAAEEAGLVVSLMPRSTWPRASWRRSRESIFAESASCFHALPSARDVVPDELRRLGAHVEVVEAYRTAVLRTPPHAQPDSFAKARGGWITFTSSSTVRNFVSTAGRLASLDGVRVASIGPVTSATAVKLGIAVDVEASTYTTDGLVDAVVSASSSPADR
jgi:uroporphyrinogen III methyltransferase/synthase